MNQHEFMTCLCDTYAVKFSIFKHHPLFPSFVSAKLVWPVCLSKLNLNKFSGLLSELLTLNQKQLVDLAEFSALD